MKPFLILTFAALLCVGCKKDDEPTQPPPSNTGTGSCNFTTELVVVDGTNKPIQKPNCHTTGTYYAEFLVDTSAAPTGVALAFSTTSSPDTGTYTVVPDVPSVTTGKVYVEYYDPSTAWHGTSGSVHVASQSGMKVYTFCSLTLNAGGTNNKTVSLRGTCN